MEIAKWCANVLLPSKGNHGLSHMVDFLAWRPGSRSTCNCKISSSNVRLNEKKIEVNCFWNGVTGCASENGKILIFIFKQLPNPHFWNFFLKIFLDICQCLYFINKLSKLFWPSRLIQNKVIGQGWRMSWGRILNPTLVVQLQTWAGWNFGNKPYPRCSLIRWPWLSLHLWGLDFMTAFGLWPKFLYVEYHMLSSYLQQILDKKILSEHSVDPVRTFFYAHKLIWIHVVWYCPLFWPFPQKK